jgi:drug/metabolite transporter (DMT)-like permease
MHRALIFALWLALAPAAPAGPREYLRTHKEVLLGDFVGIAGPAVWATQAVRHRHVSPAGAGVQSGAIAGSTVFLNHFWRHWSNSGDESINPRMQWLWVAPVGIISGGLTYCYATGTNTRFPAARLPHYRN